MYLHIISSHRPPSVECPLRAHCWGALGGHVGGLAVRGGLGVAGTVAPVGEGGRGLLVGGLLVVGGRALAVGGEGGLLFFHDDGGLGGGAPGGHCGIVQLLGEDDGDAGGDEGGGVGGRGVVGEAHLGVASPVAVEAAGGHGGQDEHGPHQHRGDEEGEEVVVRRVQRFFGPSRQTRTRLLRCQHQGRVGGGGCRGSDTTLWG